MKKITFLLSLFITSLLSYSSFSQTPTPGTMEFGTGVVFIANSASPSVDHSVTAFLNRFDMSAITTGTIYMATADAGNEGGTSTIGAPGEAVLGWLGNGIASISSGTLTTDNGGEIGLTSAHFAYEQSIGTAVLNFTITGKKDGATVGTIVLTSPAHNSDLTLDFTSPTTGSFADIDEIVFTPASPIFGGWSIDDLVVISAVTISAPTVSTTTQDIITTVSAVLGGNVTSDGGASIIERGIVWGTTSNPTIANTKKANGTVTGVFSETVDGFPSNTTIHVRAYATNSVGTSYGSNISFTTEQLGTSNFITLGSPNSGGTDFKTTASNINYVVSNIMSNDASGMFINNFTNGASQTFTIKADGTNAESFSVDVLNVKSFTTQTFDQTSTVVFKDKSGTTIQTMTLNGDKELTPNATSLFSFFDNGTTAPVNLVAEIIFTIVPPDGAQDVSNWTLTDITISNVAAPSNSPTITFGDSNKTYGDANFDLGATSNSAGAITYTIEGVNTTGTTLSGASNKTVNLGDAGSLTIRATQAANGIYSSGTKDITLTINKKALTITGITADDMVYNGHIQGTVSGTVSLVGVVSGDIVSTAAPHYDFPSKNVGTNLVMSVGHLLIGADAGNYTVTEPTNLSANITAKSLTVIGLTGDNKVYDGMSTASASGTAVLSGVESGDTVILGGTSDYTFASANVGTGIIISTTGFTISGGDSGNYSLTQPTLSADISTATLTITADDQTKAYGDANPAFTISYSGFKNSETSAVLTTVPTASSIATPTTNVGDVDIDVSGGLDDNYDFLYVKGTLTIGKATLTVTGDDQTKDYGDANPAFTISYSGFKNSETSAVLTTEPTGSSIATPTTNVGDVDIDVSSGLDDNYDFLYVKGTLTIGKAILTVTGDDQTRDYGDANPSFTISYSGFQNGDTSADLTTEPIASSIATATTNVGDVDIDVSGGLDDNYDFLYVKGTLTIGKSTLTVTGDGQTKSYGDANPTFTISYSGFKNGDTSADLTTEPTGSSIATTTTNVGDVDIDVSGGLDDNYDFLYVKGTLTIGKATLTVTG
ncbi:MAG: hypothetical protein JKY44_01820, partial [Flavobacteriaceae bacterium]|nr:hypothetical protein [Flavobacteriaceae bacterium]